MRSSSELKREQCMLSSEQMESSYGKHAQAVRCGERQPPMNSVSTSAIATDMSTRSRSDWESCGGECAQGLLLNQLRALRESCCLLLRSTILFMAWKLRVVIAFGNCASRGGSVS